MLLTGTRERLRVESRSLAHNALGDPALGELLVYVPPGSARDGGRG